MVKEIKATPKGVLPAGMAKSQHHIPKARAKKRPAETSPSKATAAFKRSPKKVW